MTESESVAKTQVSNPFLLGNRAYDFFKKLVQIILPAVGTLYFALAGIWGLPYGEQVVGTIMAVDLFLGVVLGISSAQYAASGAAYDGDMVIYHPEEGRKQFSLELNGDPEDIIGKKSITFKVKQDALIEPAPEPLEKKRRRKPSDNL